MISTAVKVKNLGKKYIIGKRESYRTLRDVISDNIYSPVKKISSILSGKVVKSDKLDNYIWALRDISFEIKRGEAVGIIGNNGAGKSTLLKILSRITEPTNGYAEISDTVGSLLEVGTGFNSELTGRENIYLNGAILGMTRAEIKRKFDEIVDFAEIEKFIDTPVKHYSSGMYMRLAFAVAAHLEPEILLVDEVLAVGDASFQKKCIGKMSSEAKGGKTILFVSHNMAAIRQLCPRSIQLSKGSIVSDGPTEEVIQKYLEENINNQIGGVISSDFIRGDKNKIRFLKVVLVDQNNNPKKFVRPGEEIKVQVIFDCPEILKDIRINLGFDNITGNRIFTVSDSDVRNGEPRTFSKGRFKAEITVPGILRPGMYYVGIGAHQSSAGGWWTHVPNALKFQVEEELADSNYNFGSVVVSSNWNFSNV